MATHPNEGSNSTPRGLHENQSLPNHSVSNSALQRRHNKDSLACCPPYFLTIKGGAYSVINYDITRDGKLVFPAYLQRTDRNVWGSAIRRLAFLLWMQEQERKENTGNIQICTWKHLEIYTNSRCIWHTNRSTRCEVQHLLWAHPSEVNRLCISVIQPPCRTESIITGIVRPQPHGHTIIWSLIYSAPALG